MVLTCPTGYKVSDDGTRCVKIRSQEARDKVNSYELKQKAMSKDMGIKWDSATDLQKSRIVGEIKTRENHPSLRSTESTSRGQQLYNDSFKATYGVDEKDAMLQNRGAEIMSMPEYKSVNTEGMTPEQANIARLQNDLSYQKQLTGVNLKMAEASRAETEKTRKDIGNAQEKQGESLQSLFQREAADRIKNKATFNPEYLKLTEQERQMNWLDVDENGVVSRRETPRIQERISGDSGRAPIGDVDRKKQYMAMAGEQAAAAQERYERNYSDGSSRYAKQRAVMNTNADLKQAIANRDSAAAQGIKRTIEEMEVFYGVRTDQHLQINADGSVKIIDNATGTEFNPVEQAKKDVEKERQKILKREAEANNERKAFIIANHSTENGELTIQGKRQMAENEDDYADLLADIEEASAEDMETAILAAKKRKIELDRLASVKEEPANEGAAKKQKQRLDLVNEIIDASRDINGRPSIGAVEAQAMAEEMFDAWGEDGVSQYQLFNKQLSRDNVDGALLRAHRLTGDIGKSKSFLRQAGIPEPVIEQQLEELYRGYGFSEEQIGIKKEALKVEDIMRRSFRGEDISVEEAQIVREFESNPSNRWEARRIELVETTELSGPEIANQIDEEKEALAQEKADAKKKASDATKKQAAEKMEPNSMLSDMYDLLIEGIIASDPDVVTEYIADTYDITKTKANVIMKSLLPKNSSGRYRTPTRDDQLQTVVKKIAEERTDNIADRIKLEKQQMSIATSGGYFSDDGVWIDARLEDSMEGGGTWKDGVFYKNQWDNPPTVSTPKPMPNRLYPKTGSTSPTNTATVTPSTTTEPAATSDRMTDEELLRSIESVLTE